MVNWKVSGVVLDSEDDEDDAFDSQELDLPKVKTQPTNDDPNRTEPRQLAHSIWDIPNSSSELRTATFDARHARPVTPDKAPDAQADPASSPLSSAPDIDELAEFEIELDRSADISTSRRLASEYQARSESPDPLEFEQDEVSRSHVKLTELMPEFLMDSEEEVPVPAPVPANTNANARTSSSVRSPTRQSSTPIDTAAADFAAASALASSYMRPLRPRKPIQEHPYLLENAFYSNTLKSHGLRPIRMAAEEIAARRRQAEEESQDKEFEDDSQTTNNNGQGENSEPDESRPTGQALRDLDPFSSSIGREGSPRHFGPMSSPPTSRTRETDATSPLAGERISDDDFPSLDQLLNPLNPGHVPSKRTLSPRKSPNPHQRKKRAKVLQRTSLKGSSQRDPTPLGTPSRPNQTKSTSAAEIQRVPRTASPADEQSTIDLTMPDAARSSEESYKEATEVPTTRITRISDTEPDSDSEEDIQLYRRRARGVLPASHFRLENPPKPQYSRSTIHTHSSEHLPEGNQRRGVAVRKFGKTASGARSALIAELQEGDSTDDEASKHSKSRSPKENDYIQTLIDIVEDNDNASVVEDNDIDHMLPSRPRQPNKNQGRRDSRKSTVGRAPAWPTQQKHRQQTITSHLSGSAKQKAPHSKQAVTRPRKKGENRKKNSKGTNARTARSPPRVGILDVIEPNAPRFLRVAARAARNQPDKGRSSPGRKIISLDNRRDQLDAGATLQEWRAGKIRQRASVQVRHSAHDHTHRNPLAPASLNRQTSHHDMATARAEGASLLSTAGSSAAAHKKLKMSRPRGLPQLYPSASRPALIEEDLAGQSSRLAFSKQKRFLDQLYRTRSERQNTPSIAATEALTELNAGGPAVPYPAESAPSPARPSASKLAGRRHTRKSTVPKRVDITAAQFQHANDPLPSAISTLADSESLEGQNDNVLLGLGPFGTHYSHHFERFPLPDGTYFHGETLLGSGHITEALRNGIDREVRQPKPRVFYHLSGQLLSWGPWNDEISSEFGILVDDILHKLVQPEAPSFGESTASKAAGFLRNYVQYGFSVSDDEQLEAFIMRLYDAFDGFIIRLGSLTGNQDECFVGEAVAVLMEFVVVVCWCLSLCRGVNRLAAQSWRLETLLKAVAVLCIRLLLRKGVEGIDRLYSQLQVTAFRELGLRSQHIELQAWVALMRVLSQLKIPRSGFWDVTFSVLIESSDAKSVHAERFEDMWRILFTLLPLTEFDNDGVLIHGARHSTPMEGWTLPQTILKRVFQLYESNNRQAPSFNSYCRALVGRCHYLVDQWSWYRCGTIVGTIFDFFASQNLAHLRNEEVYQSPAFLDHLHLQPSLQLEPADRCFHIFLKMAALAILKLVRGGFVKEVKNLVFRILPNHNRQYLKEQNVHQYDLAALRNHHDLLCTLFWAAPAEQRPQIQQVERLVIAASSHKEACMINLRAWNQLARFVAAKEPATSLRPLMNWQSSTFQQLLNQFDSIAPEIQQQIQDMSSHLRQEISSDMKNAIIASNKAATAETLRFSVTTSLDVVRHAANLEVAILAANVYQIQQVFLHFSSEPIEFPWGVLKDALATVEYLVDLVSAELNNRQPRFNSSELDDCIMHLDHSITTDLFSMARFVANSLHDTTDESIVVAASKAASIEHSVIVAGKMAALLMRVEAMSLTQCFKAGRVSLFPRTPMHLNLAQRRYLPLFLAVVQRRVTIDLTVIGMSRLKLWLLSICKPRQGLAYEHELAAALKQQDRANFIPASALSSVMSNEYDRHRSSFEYALRWMRGRLQHVAPVNRKELAAEFSAALRDVMKQAQDDLTAIVTDTKEHPPFMKFVRQIISLIKSRGAGICAVPGFFYTVSRYYAPPAQDPQLQAAQIQSYGVRLQEQDPRIVPQLFSYLYHNFKQALLHGRLGHEVAMLYQGMGNDAVVAFSFGRMLPAVIQATLRKPEAFVYLDVIGEAVSRHLAVRSTTQCLVDTYPEDLLTFVQALVHWVAVTQASDELYLSPEQLHIFRKTLLILNSLQAIFEAASAHPELRQTWREIEKALGQISLITQTAEGFLRTKEGQKSRELSHWDVFPECAWSGMSEPTLQPQVVAFAGELSEDIDKNWIRTEDVISIQAPARLQELQSTQGSEGLRRPKWDMQELVDSVWDQLAVWNQWWARSRGQELPWMAGEGKLPLI